MRDGRQRWPMERIDVTLRRLETKRRTWVKLIWAWTLMLDISRMIDEQHAEEIFILLSAVFAIEDRALHLVSLNKCCSSYHHPSFSNRMRSPSTIAITHLEYNLSEWNPRPHSTGESIVPRGTNSTVSSVPNATTSTDIHHPRDSTVIALSTSSSSSSTTP